MAKKWIGTGDEGGTVEKIQAILLDTTPLTFHSEQLLHPEVKCRIWFLLLMVFCMPVVIPR